MLDCMLELQRQWKVFLSELGGELYELKYQGQEGKMTLGVRTTCDVFDLGHVALEVPTRWLQQVLGIMLQYNQK